MAKAHDKKLGLIQATSIAVGTMIGARIFSIFGLGARIAGRNLPFVFVVSGVLALLGLGSNRVDRAIVRPGTLEGDPFRCVGARDAPMRDYSTAIRGFSPRGSSGSPRFL